MTTVDSRRSVDARTRSVGCVAPVEPSTFWDTEWREGILQNGGRAAEDALRLGLPPLTLAVEDCARTLQLGATGVEASPDAEAPLRVEIDREAFAELVGDERTALGLGVGARVVGDARSCEAFYAWDPVLRSVIDGRSVYREGEVELTARNGDPLDLSDRFQLGERVEDAGHFLQQAGFLLLQDVLSETEIEAIDRDMARAIEEATPDDRTSWWASTAAGRRYPCRLLDFSRRSPALSAFLGDDRYRAIGEILDDGHVPGDPFGEHFAEVTAEALLKRVDSTEGLVCLPWHRDCERGGHSRYCSGLTVGLCLTPIDEAHGGLDVLAGSHRANVTRTQLDSGTDLPAVSLRARRGDLTIHLSCAMHRSTHPTEQERRVIYAGLTLPVERDQSTARRRRLEQDRARIGDVARLEQQGIRQAREIDR